MTSSESFDFLLVGKPESLSYFTSEMYEGLTVNTISEAETLEKYFEVGQFPESLFVTVLSDLGPMSLIEIAQAFSSYVPGVKLIGVLNESDGLDFKSLKKNGFTDVFLFPIDKKYVQSTFLALKSKKGVGGKHYKPVKLIDLNPGDELPFSLSTYLPMNQKYVQLTAAGGISEKKFEILKAKGINSLLVDQDEIEKFYSYSAAQFSRLMNGGDGSLSETERQERAQGAVRDLFRSFLDKSDDATGFEQGRELLEQSKKIVESYVIQKTGVDLQGKFRELKGEGSDFYSHAQVVSTLAALLSMATGIGQPEDLAIAGLFHDIGLDRVSVDVSLFEISELSNEDRAYYLQHPKTSVLRLKDKRVTLMPKIVEIIERHHERIDGKGFPDSLPAHKVPAEAQLLGYADAYEYLSRRVPGRKIKTSLEIHGEIAERLSLSPELLGKVHTFLSNV